MVGFSLENPILYRDTIAAREEHLQEQFATLTSRLSDQEALINRMKDQVGLPVGLLWEITDGPF